MPAGSTKVTSRPGSRGITEIDSWLPSVNGLISNDPIAAGAGPSGGPSGRNTNGKLWRPHGLLAGAAPPSVGVQRPGASGARSSPGSTDATSHVACGEPPSWSALT